MNEFDKNIENLREPLQKFYGNQNLFAGFNDNGLIAIGEDREEVETITKDRLNLPKPLTQVIVVEI